MSNKKEFIEKIFLPELNDIVEGQYKVIYLKPTEYQFTAESLNGLLPAYGDTLIHNDKKYMVSYLIGDKNRFSARFVGYKQNDEEMVKVDNPVTTLI